VLKGSPALIFESNGEDGRVPGLFALLRLALRAQPRSFPKVSRAVPRDAPNSKLRYLVLMKTGVSFNSRSAPFCPEIVPRFNGERNRPSSKDIESGTRNRKTKPVGGGEGFPTFFVSWPSGVI
jgi:hypothetical protein